LSIKWLDDYEDGLAEITAYFANQGKHPTPKQIEEMQRFRVKWELVKATQEIRNEIKIGNDKMENQNEMIKRIHKLYDK
tara:strand:- start:2652 stop:2888 length:237 start_codon:yes stop_codon:yes gene_type:complete